jgi:hypothetical protein
MIELAELCWCQVELVGLVVRRLVMLIKLAEDLFED